MYVHVLVVSGAISIRVMGRKRLYYAAFKLAAVKDAEKTTNSAAARKFMVDKRRIRELSMQ